MKSPSLEKVEFSSWEEFLKKFREKVDELECTSDAKEILHGILSMSEMCKKEVAAIVPLKIGLECFHNVYQLRPFLDEWAPNFGFCVWALSDIYAYIGLVMRPDHYYQEVVDIISQVPTDIPIIGFTAMKMFELTCTVKAT